MVIFAKIIITKTHQVLLTKDFGEDGTFVVEAKASFPMAYPSIVIGFAKEEQRDKCFEDYGVELAELFIAQVSSVLDDE